jgi:hypothetical protein
MLDQVLEAGGSRLIGCSSPGRPAISVHYMVRGLEYVCLDDLFVAGYIRLEMHRSECYVAYIALGMMRLKPDRDLK